MDTDEEPLLFKAQLFALTGVQPERQKVILKGVVLKDDPTGWDPLKPKLKNGVTLLMMGTKDEDSLVALKESDKPQVTLKKLKCFRMQCAISTIIKASGEGIFRRIVYLKLYFLIVGIILK